MRMIIEILLKIKMKIVLDKILIKDRTRCYQTQDSSLNIMVLVVFIVPSKVFQI